MPRTRTALRMTLLALLSLSFGVAFAQHTGAPLDCATLQGEQSLEGQLAVLEDPSQSWTLADVRARDDRFTSVRTSEPSLGFSYSALWVRFAVRNGGAAPVRWILALNQPTLDDVQLFAVGAGEPVMLASTGDALPFDTRALRYADFAFELLNAPGELTTYYLRVQTSSALRAPLMAWTPDAYFQHQARVAMGLGFSYGALLVFALYHLLAYWRLCYPEHRWYALLLFAMLLVEASLRGHLFQYLAPTLPALANRLLPASLALCMLGFALFFRALLERYPAALARAETDSPRLFARAMRSAAWLAIGLAAMLPVGLAIRLICLLLVAMSVVGAILMGKIRAFWRQRVLRTYLLSWVPLLGTVAIAILRYGAFIPSYSLSEAVLPLGLVVQAMAGSYVLLSLARQNIDMLMHAEREAVLANRAKDEFLATMSHELRTPLNAIINIPAGLAEQLQMVRRARCEACGAAFLLADTEQVEAGSACPACGAKRLRAADERRFTGDPEEALDLLRRVERLGLHLLKLVNRVLDWSKAASGMLQLDLQTADLDRLLDQVVTDIQGVAESKQLQVRVERSGGAAPLLLDEVRITQVLWNLLDNAIKFSKEGSTITIERRSSAQEEVVAIRDRGIGIAPEHMARLFHAFEQLHQGNTRRYGGTGLGLSISHKLVTLHGGELSAASVLGQGSTFTLRLPRTRPTCT